MLERQSALMEVQYMPKKLVRDLIPNIVKSKEVTFKNLDDADYLSALQDKLMEEVYEFLNARSENEKLEELVDIQEVLDALVDQGNWNSSFKLAKERKVAERGAFKHKILMDSPEKHKEGCLFCEIQKEADLVYEDNVCYAIKDKFPVSPGHLLVIPKEHFKDWFQTPEPIQNHLMTVVSKNSPLLFKRGHI